MKLAFLSICLLLTSLSFQRTFIKNDTHAAKNKVTSLKMVVVGDMGQVGMHSQAGAWERD